MGFTFPLRMRIYGGKCAKDRRCICHLHFWSCRHASGKESMVFFVLMRSIKAKLCVVAVENVLLLREVAKEALGYYKLRLKDLVGIMGLTLMESQTLNQKVKGLLWRVISWVTLEIYPL